MSTNKIENLNEQLVFILDRQDSILESTKSNDGVYMLSGSAAVFGEENNNNRIYEEAEYLPHLEYLNDKIKQNRLVGELDHPEKFDVSLKNISHIITNLDYDKESRNLKIKVKLLDTPAGLIAKSLVDAGVPLSISSRAAGSVANDKKVQIKKIFTYDLVADPGFQNAQLERVYESAGFSSEKIDDIRNNNITTSLFCLNESFGLENESNMKIYKVENNEEFINLVSKTEKNNSTKMEEKKEFVTTEELNQYSLMLAEQLDAINKKLEEVKIKKEELTVIQNPIVENDSEIATTETSDVISEDKNVLMERIEKLEAFSEYLAENLDTAIKYGEYLAENLDQSISYSKYLAENLDGNITEVNAIDEKINKGISYSEYIAESTDSNIEQIKGLTTKLDKSIAYSEYLGENLDKGIAFSEYLGENLNSSLIETDKINEKLDKSIAYSEYLGENLDKGIAFSEYLGENLNKGLEFSDYLSEKLKRSISYSEYIAEAYAAKETNSVDGTQALRESVELTAKGEQKTSGFAGNYDSLDEKINSLIESVKTTKTETVINEGATLTPNNETETKKVETESLNENTKTQTGLEFIDQMPEEYTQIWESLNDGHKQSIIAQSSFYKLNTPYQIKNFWSTRQLTSKVLGLQKINESEEQINTATKPYSNEYMEMIAKQLEGKFPKK